MNRWESAVTHSDAEALEFVADYFAAADRSVLLIAAAGFDPRSTVVTRQISPVVTKLRAVFIREERDKPHPDLLERARLNLIQLSDLVPEHTTLPINIFDAQDGAAVGAKHLIRQIVPHISLPWPPTDIVIDLSALSIGMFFPLVRYVFETYGRDPGGPNIHLFVAEDTDLDTGIVPEHADQAMYIPGFSGGALLDENSSAARLWIPQLVANRKDALRRIHDFVRADETCPILPFPAKQLRRADNLLEEFLTEVVDAWTVDPRNYVYAAEREPMDLYRILLRLDDARKRVYQAHGGSLLILSPVGSKVLAMGALLAALDRDFPVAYLESVGYTLLPSAAPDPDRTWPLVHVWLSGEAYA
jgi:hypothetical protein